MGRAIGEAGNHVFADPAVEFVDVRRGRRRGLQLTYWNTWPGPAGSSLSDERVLCACAHSVGGQGWDEPGIGALNPDADQAAVRLLPYFNAWCWGVWRDRWESIMDPRGTGNVTRAARLRSGYDWKIHARIIPQGNYLVAIPDASRSQNIGQHGGWAASPADFAAPRPHRSGPSAEPMSRTGSRKRPEAAA